MEVEKKDDGVTQLQVGASESAEQKFEEGEAVKKRQRID
jgi:hypothetical protein